MADEGVRRVYRRAVVDGSLEQAAFIRSRQRGGLITGEAVKLAAELGCEASQLIIPSPLVDWSKWVERKNLLERVLSVMGRPFLVRFAADCAERVLNVFEAAYPGDDGPREAIVAARAWAERPCEELRMAAAAAYTAGDAYAASAAYAARSASVADVARSASAASAAYAARSAGAAYAARSAACSAAYTARSAACSAAADVAADVAYTAYTAAADVAADVAYIAYTAAAAADGAAEEYEEYEWQRVRLVDCLLGL